MRVLEDGAVEHQFVEFIPFSMAGRYVKERSRDASVRLGRWERTVDWGGGVTCVLVFDGGFMSVYTSLSLSHIHTSCDYIY